MANPKPCNEWLDPQNFKNYEVLMTSHMLKHLSGSLHINTFVSGFPNGRP